MLVLRTQLASLQVNPDFANLREKIQAIASALEEQEAIPAIKEEMPNSGHRQRRMVAGYDGSKAGNRAEKAAGIGKAD
jgi:hypothetical protein